MKNKPKLIVRISRFGDERYDSYAELNWIPLTAFTLGIGTIGMLIARKICRSILNYEEHEEQKGRLRQMRLGLHPRMKD